MNLKRELPLLLIVLIPFVYLMLIWSGLPETVPTHWNLEGEIDNWGSKWTMVMIPFLLPLLTYIIFTIVPKIDPKNKIQSDSGKYQNLKFALTTFMAVLAVFILYSIKEQSLTNPNYIILGLGFLYIILGNYMKTLKANYFIGIRTPWTLENEKVWKTTHILAGKLWFVGGLLVIVSSLLTKNAFNSIFFLATTLTITIIPIVYSYLQFKKINSKNTI